MNPQPRLALNDGQAIPQLGLGVWRTPNDGAASVVGAALRVGYRCIDTATLYDNEQGVGEGVRASSVARDEIFVTSKLWNSDHGYDAALRAFEASMKRLGLDSLELYLIHWPAPRRDLYVETWRALIRLREEGRVRSIGVSNFNAAEIDRLIGETGVTPAINQIELHPRFQQRALREANAERGVVTQCWSPLGRGALLSDPAITAIAAKHKRTPAQVVIRWHLDSGLAAIPKSANAGRIAENFDVFGFSLDAKDMAAIARLDSADGRVGPNPATASF